MNYKELGESFFCSQLEEIVNNNPYFSFIILSSIMEFMGHCHRQGHNKKDDTVRAIFFDLINNVKALEDYKLLNYNAVIKDSKSGNDVVIANNFLYKYLRCGMLHKMIPQKDIVLGPDRNDLSKKIVGAKELYEDMKKAWEELKSSQDVSSYMESTDALTVFDEFSASTFTSIVEDESQSSNTKSESSCEDELIAAEKS